MLTSILPVNSFSLTNFSDRPSLLGYASQSTYQTVLENLPHGILLLTETGQSVYANLIAQKICAQLNPDTTDFKLPSAIWQVCQQATRERRTASDQVLSLISEIWVNRGTLLRLQVQWISGQPDHNYYLVNLEDCQQANRDRAISESRHYGLTDREAEVWLLRRSGYSYQAIAEQLCITTNTVKKHCKNIYSKQKIYLDLDE